MGVLLPPIHFHLCPVNSKEITSRCASGSTTTLIQRQTISISFSLPGLLIANCQLLSLHHPYQHSLSKGHIDEGGGGAESESQPDAICDEERRKRPEHVQKKQDWKENAVLIA